MRSCANPIRRWRSVISTPRRNIWICIAIFWALIPYSKFALVENFWETGYGMPSFTLLGEQIIRFPFILTSSYPHELLHNWWGNGVFVASTGGNWCEGLTAYLADHLFAEQRGQGARPPARHPATGHGLRHAGERLSGCRGFASRHNAVTEAIGYGKTAMMWNMLRDKVGDAQFVTALQAFYRDNRFREASFDDIEKSFEAVSGLDLREFFDQWVKDTGTPELQLDRAAGDGDRIDLIAIAGATRAPVCAGCSGGHRDRSGRSRPEPFRCRPTGRAST